MRDPDLRVEITVQRAEEWLSTDLPSWATHTRFHARLVEREGVVVLRAKETAWAVGYTIFDKQMSHLHYIETRKDCRRRGMAARLWGRVREEAVHRDNLTASAHSGDGIRRLVAWSFTEADGMWTWRRSR